MKVSVFIATSLDGYIAKPDGDIDWLMDKRYELENDDDMGYGALYNACDALVMGRNAYEKVAGFDEWPYVGKRVIVLSRTLSDAQKLPEDVELFHGELDALMEMLTDEGVGHIYIDGGRVIQSFLQVGLVNEMTLTSVPVLLGEGIRLFGSLPKVQHFTLESAKGYPNGMVQSIYTPTT